MKVNPGVAFTGKVDQMWDKDLATWQAKLNFVNFLSMWQHRWEGGSTGAGIILFFLGGFDEDQLR